MPYTLIKGSFHIFNPDNPHNGPEPDGDTLKFKPDNRQLIMNLPKPNWAPKFNLAGLTSIRFEGIDALEIHFTVEGDTFHQKMDLAIGGRDALLQQMGFGRITFFADKPFRVESVEHHPIPGYILSNGLDTYGRTIAFVFTGSTAVTDGSLIFLTPGMLDTSLNAFMLRSGKAYGEFYLSLPAELRDYLQSIVTTARISATGVWAEDAVSVGASALITGLDPLQQLVLWPKLFRRLVSYFQSGFSNLSMFDTWLRADPRNRDDRLLLPNRELGNMHDLIVTEGDVVHLAFLPEDVVIVPDDYQLTLPAPLPQLQTTGAVRIIAALINPAREERGHETVTILNTTNTDIDLNGWHIADQTRRQQLQGVIERGNAIRIKLGNNVTLNNRRDTITLFDPDGQNISQVSYEPKNLPKEGNTLVF